MENCHTYYMKEALIEAKKAQAIGEIPVGAILVLEGNIIGRGHNLREKRGDIAAHAEIIALQEGAKAVGHWRLQGADLYVTLEPCPMCAGAIQQAGLRRCIYGADIEVEGKIPYRASDLLDHPALGHRVLLLSGVLQEEAKQLLTGFFKNKRI